MNEQEIQLLPELPESMDAPVEAGQLMGYVRVELNGRTLARLPVVSAGAAEMKGLGSSLKNILGKWGMR